MGSTATPPSLAMFATPALFEGLFLAGREHQPERRLNSVFTSSSDTRSCGLLRPGQARLDGLDIELDGLGMPRSARVGSGTTPVPSRKFPRARHVQRSRPVRRK